MRYKGVTLRGRATPDGYYYKVSAHYGQRTNSVLVPLERFKAMSDLQKIHWLRSTRTSLLNLHGIKES